MGNSSSKQITQKKYSKIFLQRNTAALKIQRWWKGILKERIRIQNTFKWLSSLTPYKSVLATEAVKEYYSEYYSSSENETV
jgi:hypothetical protein